ncbi:hypothetical protein [Mannheimia massilioguelmaensis]|uniref:hypothetical protein n=1 Tax=Mannheimia massilioguelmaensis TaxID=1604354 RepID=UPI0005C8A4B6|nr:hypothetical protein [Mannheimia massilioguelmaensis]
MRFVLFILVSVSSGCYLGNGSPSEFNYWIKNGEHISYSDIKVCEKKVYALLDSRFKHLDAIENNIGIVSMRKNYREEYDEYISYIKKATPKISECYYDMGYRFTAPYYWCLSRDHGGANTETCKVNQKYR